MANEVYEGQELTVIYTDTDGVDFGPLTIRVDYWAPGNQTSAPTGTIDSGDISKNVSEVTILFAEGILSPASKPTGEEWRYQIIKESEIELADLVEFYNKKYNDHIKTNLELI